MLFRGNSGTLWYEENRRFFMENKDKNKNQFSDERKKRIINY